MTGADDLDISRLGQDACLLEGIGTTRAIRWLRPDRCRRR